MSRTAFTRSVVFLSIQLNLLTDVASYSTLVNEEFQDHSPYPVHAGRERHWVDIHLPLRIHDDLDISCGPSRRNGRFNCRGTATTNPKKCVHSPTRLPERTPRIRDLNSHNPASSRNFPDFVLFFFFFTVTSSSH